MNDQSETLARRTARRLSRRVVRDDRGIAMMAAVLLVMIMGGLSLLVLAMVASQVTPTQFAQKNTRTVFAAEAGMNTALAEIRAAAAAPDYTGKIYGDRTKLPCTVNGPVDLTGADLTYSVTVQYFTSSPTGKDAAWRTANHLTCTPGSGVPVQPTYAVITSQGLANGVPGLATTVGDRTLTSTYQFQVTNTNVPGGLIYAFGDQFCLQANGTTAGSTITYVAAALCGTNDVTQLWVYDTDYEIKLASSTLGGTALCITGPPDTSTASVSAKLQACASSTSASRWNQLWSWQGGAVWEGESTAINGYSGYCLYSGVTSGDPLGRTLSAAKQCASNQPWGSFNPDPRVGAGAASYSSKQIVNYLEFGRCFDVTDTDVNKAFMIVYPCKQDPSGGSQLPWNHKWYYAEPATGVASAGPQQIYVLQNNSTSAKYCLQSPASGVSPAYPTLVTCNSTAANQKWTRYNDTGSYASSYTFVDYLGRCVALGDKYSSSWSKLIVATCTGGPEQKWNAPANSANAAVDNVRELP